MTDGFQPNPHRQNRSFDRDEFDGHEANLRKPRGGLPWWVWVVIAVPFLGMAVLFCGGVAAGFLWSFREAAAPAPAVAPPAPAPEMPAAPQPDKE